MSDTPPGHEPRPPRFDGDDAQVVLLALAGLVGVPAILGALVLKGVGAALAVALIGVLVWLHLAQLIPTDRETAALRRAPGPVERVVVILLGVVGVAIGVGFLLSSRTGG